MTSMQRDPNPAWLEPAWASCDSPINSHPKVQQFQLWAPKPFGTRMLIDLCQKKGCLTSCQKHDLHLASELSGSTGGSKAKVWGCLMQLLSNSLAILRLTLLNNLTFRRSCSSEKKTKKQVSFQLSRTLGDDQLWSKLSRSQLHVQNHSTTHHFKYTFTSRHENSDVLEMDLSTRPGVLLKLHSKLAHASSPNATF